MSDSSEQPAFKMASDQYEYMLAEVLHELSRTSNPLFEYKTKVAHSMNSYYLEELIPRIEKRRFKKDKISRWGRIAITLSNEKFTVFQPQWLVPLQEELAAISSTLPEQPEVSTNYVVAWRSALGSSVVVGELVPEVQLELSEARKQYWIAKVDQINAETRPELPPSL
ncbi:hypothetical protein KW794_01410 [Candidatus Saccharibacteria bacterium]|nr:hypothetical protein [Candidatus Saccharibacteria bacterium]